MSMSRATSALSFTLLLLAGCGSPGLVGRAGSPQGEGGGGTGSQGSGGSPGEKADGTGGGGGGNGSNSGGGAGEKDAGEAAPCEPTCTDKDCGDDGCGGDCGSCAKDSFCGSQGLCTTISECNDGEDNDGDGLVDFEGGDLGCTQPNGNVEAARPDEDSVVFGVQNDGWTVFEPTEDSVICYVDSDRDGPGEGTAMWPYGSVSDCAAKLSADGAASNGAPDFVLLKRGATASYGSLGGLGDGESIAAPIVVSTWGEDASRPDVSGIGAVRFAAYLGVLFEARGVGAATPTGGDHVWIEGCMAKGPDTPMNSVETKGLRLAYNVNIQQADAGTSFYLTKTDPLFVYGNITENSEALQHAYYMPRGNCQPIKYQHRIVDTRWNVTYSNGGTREMIKQRPAGTAQGNISYAPNAAGGWHHQAMGQCSDGDLACATEPLDECGQCGHCLRVIAVDDNVCVASGGGNAVHLDFLQFLTLKAEYSAIRNNIGITGDCLISELPNDIGTRTGNFHMPKQLDANRAGYDLMDLYYEDVLEGSGEGTAGDAKVIEYMIERTNFRSIPKLATADCLRAFSELVRDEIQSGSYTAKDASKFDAGDYACDGVGLSVSEGNGKLWASGYPIY